MLRAAVLGSALLLAGCGPERLRYRMTVEVDTPQGVRSGTGVHELVNHGNTPWLPGGQFDHVEELGEAIAIDLPNGTLFVLLWGSSWALSEALRHGTVTPAVDLSAAQQWPRSMRQVIRTARAAKVAASVTPEQLNPQVRFKFLVMARFRDMDDPLSLERIDPNDLEASFGRDTRLRRIRFEVTTDEISTTLARKLPWIEHPERFRTDPNNRFTNRLPHEIDGFKSGLKR